MGDPDYAADKADEQAASERGRGAFAAARYLEAFAHLHSALLKRAIRWFREEGVSLHKPVGAVTPTALIVGLTFAAHAEVRERGEECPPKLDTAAALFASIAELRMALAAPSPKPDAPFPSCSFPG
jgi:hypothetical protein